mmetsp:Transcript_7787/g.8904  ORF Transcript_7787/g.8904 Transcript_7787/m.8904 type:complete len:371 (+) Transcript_7787:30-1142(+)
MAAAQPIDAPLRTRRAQAPQATPSSGQKTVHVQLKLTDQVATSLRTLHARKLKAPTPLNIMVVGQSGVGKRSIIQQVFGFDAARVAGLDASGERQMQHIKADVGEFNVLDLEVLETAGLGDHFRGQGIGPLTQILKSRLRQYALDRVNVKNARDNRIHLVLYCTAPHRFTKHDEDWVRRLSQYSNVAVVGTKADGLSPSERAEYKKKVKKTMNAPARVSQTDTQLGIKPERRPEHLLHNGNFLFGPDGSPYTVIAQNRTYTFTKDKALFNETSYADLALLRDDLFGSKMIGLRNRTHALYTQTYNAGELRGPTYLNWKPYVGLGLGLAFGEGFNRLRDPDMTFTPGIGHAVGAMTGIIFGSMHHQMFGKL